MGMDQAVTYLKASFQLEGQENLSRLKTFCFPYFKDAGYREKLKTEFIRAACPPDEARALTPQLLDELLNT